MFKTNVKRRSTSAAINRVLCCTVCSSVFLSLFIICNGQQVSQGTAPTVLPAAPLQASTYPASAVMLYPQQPSLQLSSAPAGNYVLAQTFPTSAPGGATSSGAAPAVVNVPTIQQQPVGGQRAFLPLNSPYSMNQNSGQMYQISTDGAPILVPSSPSQFFSKPTGRQSHHGTPWASQRSRLAVVPPNSVVGPTGASASLNQQNAFYVTPSLTEPNFGTPLSSPLTSMPQPGSFLIVSNAANEQTQAQSTLSEASSYNIPVPTDASNGLIRYNIVSISDDPPHLTALQKLNWMAMQRKQLRSSKQLASQGTDEATSNVYYDILNQPRVSTSFGPSNPITLQAPFYTVSNGPMSSGGLTALSSSTPGAPNQLMQQTQQQALPTLAVPVWRAVTTVEKPNSRNEGIDIYDFHQSHYLNGTQVLDPSDYAFTQSAANGALSAEVVPKKPDVAVLQGPSNTRKQHKKQARST